MNYDVKWTKESEVTFNKNIEYLSESWDLLTINNFLDRVDAVIEILKSTPELYPVYRKRNKVRKMYLK